MRRKALISDIEAEKLAEEIEIEKGYKVCGYPGIADDGESVTICRNKSGFKTAHVGQGRCFSHGGCGGNKTAGGLYSKYLQKKPDILQKYQNFLEDEDIKKIDNEIALLRTQLAKDLEKPGKGNDALDSATIRLIDSITRVVERKIRMEEGQKYTLSIDGVRNLILQTVTIIKDEVSDTPTQIRIMERLNKEIRV